MSDARLVLRRRFTAAHHYGLAHASEDDNRALFGDQVDAHTHQWTVEVHVRGPVDARTGFVTDLGALEAAVAGVMAGWDGGDLNAVVPEVAAGTMQPSTEALAQWLFRQLESAVEAPASLDRVAVFESDTLGAVYPA